MNLWDIEELRPLEEIGRHRGVSFSLRGGVGFRLALRAPASFIEDPFGRLSIPLEVGPDDFGVRESKPTLFDLTPFASDVDLEHSGGPKLTSLLLEDILAAVPAAECFRWDIRSAKEKRGRLLEVGGNLIPARMLEITGASPDGLVDREEGLRDIAHRSFRYVRNPFFDASHSFRLGRDIEAFSALLYLQTLAEADVPATELATQPGWDEIRRVFLDGSDDVFLISVLQQNATLRGRLRHLLKSAAMAFPHAPAFAYAASGCGLDAWLSRIAPAIPELRQEPALRFLTGPGTLPIGPIVASDRLLGDLYRLEVLPLPWTNAPLPDVTLPTPGIGERVILVSPRMTVKAGIALDPSISTAEPGEDEGPTPAVTSEPGLAVQEFIHIEVPPVLFAFGEVDGAIANMSEENLSAYLILKEQDGRWTPFALPTVVQRPTRNNQRHSQRMPFEMPDLVVPFVTPSPRLVIRMNCLGLLSSLQEHTRAHVVLVGQAEEGEMSSPRQRIHGQGGDRGHLPGQEQPFRFGETSE